MDPTPEDICEIFENMCVREIKPTSLTPEDCRDRRKNTSVVRTKEGPIRGYIDSKIDGTYYTFKSIPYGKPPIGRLRFLPPQPAAPWTDELDCTKDSPKPVSIGRGIEIIGTEDCLYLEVITPNIQPDKPMPVMFWIPSYGFCFLLEEVYDPSLLIDQDIVYVHCHIRVGPFGFLSINDMSAPGNIGLKDLVMGLKWVQRNISAFGGDPNNVTIFGSSSGGSMVHYMMLSPMANGLFHKAILQSGTAFNNWSIDRNPTAVVTELATRLGIQEVCMVTLVEKLKECSKDEIMSVFWNMSFVQYFKGEDVNLDSIFKPCIEQEYEGQQAFLTKSPAMIIKSGNFNKVPIIIGSNIREAEFINYMKKEYYNYKKINENVRLMVPKPLAVEDNLDARIGQKILNFYSGEDSLNEDNINQYLQVVTDFFFTYHVTKSVQLHATFSPECPIYYYILTQAGEWTIPKDLRFFNSNGHHGEIPFIFRIVPTVGLEPAKGTRDSVTTRSRVVKMWTNFAKYGNPTPDKDDPLLQITWDPVENANKLNYLSIGSELTKGRNPFNDRMNFWDDLLNRHPFLKILGFFQEMGLIF